MQSRDYDIGIALSSAFDLIRNKPVWMLVWGALLWVLPLLPIIPIILMVTENLDTLKQDPESLSDALAVNMMSNLASIIQFVLAVPIIAAITRYVLGKAPGRFAGLKIGMDEVWIFVICIAGYFTIFIGTMVALLPAFIVGMIIWIGMANENAAVLTGIVFSLFSMLPLLWLAVRLSLIFPASIDLNTFAIGPAWKATRGKFWPMFGTWFIVGLITLAVSIIAIVIFVVIGAVVYFIGSSAGWTAGETTGDWNWWPMLGLGALLYAVPAMWLTGVTYSISMAPFASAWLQLKLANVDAPTTVSEPSESQGYSV